MSTKDSIDNKENKLRVVYLAGPYTHESPEVQATRRMVFSHMAGLILLKEKDIAIIDPITMSAAIVDRHPEAFNGKFDCWEKVDYELIRRADEVYVMAIDGYKQSKGVQAEIKFAKSIGTPVRFIDFRDEKLDDYYTLVGLEA